ncbi:GNAT family N-acetyltransferase [bacterium]|nr:GNAT family N-acetyltransferase [bacterium]
MQIRPVTSSDRDRWLAMRVALWPEGSRDEHAAEIDEIYDGSATEPQAVLVAEHDDGSLAGFAELSIRPCAEGCRTTRVAYLEGWYVAPEARRMGVGRALIRAAEDWGRQQGCSEFASDTETDNDSSIAAHLALGFEDAGLVQCFRKDL